MAFGSVGKRKAERRDCYVKAQAIVPGQDPIDCIIMNFSATGARARLVKEAQLPTRFKLYIPSRPETKPVFLRWRNALEFGCSYSTGLADEESMFALFERVEKLEARIAAGPGATDAESQIDPVPADRIADFESKLAAIEAKFVAERERADAPAHPDPELVARISEFESRLAASEAACASIADLSKPPSFDPGELEERIEQLRKVVAEHAERPVTPDPSHSRLDTMVSDLRDTQAQVKKSAQDARQFAERLGVRLDQMQLSTELIPNLVERVARLEIGGRSSGVNESGDAAQVDSGVLRRMADVEAKLVSLRAGQARTLDLTRFERRIDAASEEAREHADRIERFLKARIDQIEQRPVAHAATPGASEMRALEERISNLEVAIVDMRADLPLANSENEVEARLTRIEERNGEVVRTLRNVLALLTERQERQQRAS